MVKSSAVQVYAALVLASLPVILADALTTTCYFSAPVISSAVHAVVDSLEWSNVTIIYTESNSDPHSQYLNTTRHDVLIRHPIGTVVPHDDAKMDVVSTTTDNAITRFNGITGDVQNSLVTIDDSGSVNIPTGQSYKINGTALSAPDVGAVTKLSTTTDNAITRFDGIAGAVQNSLVTIDDSGSVNIPTGQSYKINGTALSASDVGAAASGHNHDGTYCRWRGASASEPSSPIAGDIWIDTSGTATPKIYSGSAWISLI